MTPIELLDLIIDRAPKLRDAGVLQVSVEGVSFTLARTGNVASDEEEAEHSDDDDDLNPLDDPRTYGRTSKHKAPQFRGEL